MNNEFEYNEENDEYIYDSDTNPEIGTIVSNSEGITPPPGLISKICNMPSVDTEEEDGQDFEFCRTVNLIAAVAERAKDAFITEDGITPELHMARLSTPINHNTGNGSYDKGCTTLFYDGDLVNITTCTDIGMVGTTERPEKDNIFNSHYGIAEEGNLRDVAKRMLEKITNKNKTVVNYTAEAKANLDQFKIDMMVEHVTMALKNGGAAKDVIDEFVDKVNLHVRKLALIHALSRHQVCTAIGIRSLNWATNLVKHSLTTVEHRVNNKHIYGTYL